MANLKKPPADDFPTATWGRWKQGLNELRDAVAQVPGTGIRVPATIDANGKLTPTGGDMIVDTYLGAGSDNLDFFSFAPVPDGVSIAVGINNAARTVGIRHLMPSADPDAGSIALIDGVSQGDTINLDGPTKWCRFQRQGSVFVERERHGFPGGNPIGTQDLNAGGFALYNVRAFPRAQTALPYTVQRTVDLGRFVLFTPPGTVTLPDPNSRADPDNDEWWKFGDMILWEAGSTDLITRLWNGNPPPHPLNHDRAYGQYAQGWWFVSSNATSGLLEWRLQGTTRGTAAPPPVGPPPPPPPPGVPPPPPPPPLVTTDRQMPFTQIAADLAMAPGSLAWQSAGSFSAAYAANEKWLYLCTYSTSGAGSTANNAVVTRFVRNLGTDTTVGNSGRSRWQPDVARQGFIWGQSYGAAGGTATFRVEAQNGSTGSAHTIGAPLFVGLRLETDEDVATFTGNASDNAGTWTDVVTLTKTTVADDHVIVAGFEVGWSQGLLKADVRLTIDGVAPFPLAYMTADAMKQGFFATVWPATLTAASHVFKLQIRLTPGQTLAGTVTGTNGTVALLRAGRFPQVDWKTNGSPQTSVVSTFTDSVSQSWSLKNGYFTLLLGSLQAYCSNSANGSSLNYRMQRNGADLLPLGKMGVRVDDAWTEQSPFMMAVVQPQRVTDAFTIGFASANGADQVQCEGVALVALATRA